MGNKIRNERGSALAFVIMVMAVLMVLGTSLLVVSMAEARQSIRQENNTQAHYTARTGAEVLASMIREADDDEDILSLINQGALSGEIDGKEFSARVEKIDEDLDKLRIHSTGYESGLENNVELILNRGPLSFDYPLFSASKDIFMNIGNSAAGAIIGGDVGTNADGFDGDSSRVVDGVIDTSVGLVLERVNYELFQDYEFGSIGDIPDNLMPFEENGRVFITVEDFDEGKEFQKNEDLNNNIEEINLLVTNKFDFGGNDSVSSPDDMILNIFIHEDVTEANMRGNATLNHRGIVYGQKTTFRIRGGGGGTTKGSIIAERIHVHGGGNHNISFDDDLDSDVFPMNYMKVMWEN